MTETFERSGLTCHACDHPIEWMDGKLYHFRETIDSGSIKQFTLSKECVCPACICKEARDKAGGSLGDS